MKRLSIVASLVGGLWMVAAVAQPFAVTDRSASHLMVVLRETPGANKQDEALVPTGKVKLKLADGREVEVDFAHFELLGDMHIQFVFDSEKMISGAKPEELSRLNLSPDAALSLAIGNIKRVYGNPIVLSVFAGVMKVQGRSSDFNSSYFLNREFWCSLLKEHPDGLVVAVPQRGHLLFAPLSKTESVNRLRQT